MTSGTIHALGADLFVVEGIRPSPAAAVYRRGDQLCLLDTGTGPAQRAAIRAIAASYGSVQELVLLSSVAEQRPDDNDDLLDELPAAHRRHLRPGGARCDQDAPRSVPVEDYAVLDGTGSVQVGSQTWTGWPFGTSGLSVLRIGPSDSGRVVFHVVGCRALILADLLPDRTRDRDHRVSADTVRSLLGLLDDSAVRVVSAGSGAPLDAAAYRRLLLSSTDA